MSGEITVFPIAAFNDNYIWCLSNGHQSVVVDPGDAAPVIKHLDAMGLTLSAILITHHHWDHTNGIEDLLAVYGDIPVYGPANQINAINTQVKEGDKVQIPELGTEFDVIAIPGHTLDHIGYYGSAGLFCGDTLFSGGCGRLFEGSPKQMLGSLNKLAALPNTTPVYCTHEYTLANLRFALAVEPDNAELQIYNAWAESQRRQDLPTLPSNIGQEKAINPFLRSDKPAIKASAERQAGVEMADDVAIFSQIRQWKDNF